MENYIMKHDFAILIYKEEDMIEYNAAIKALTATKKTKRMGQSARRKNQQGLQNTIDISRERLGDHNGKRQRKGRIYNRSAKLPDKEIKIRAAAVAARQLKQPRSARGRL